MNTSEQGIKFVAGFEGLRLKAYPDPGTGGEPITIGYGHTGNVKLGDTVTEAEAYDLLDGDLMHSEDVVNALVKVPITQNEFDALVSFVFNCGEGNFKKSSLLRLLNQMAYDAAADQFPLWNKAAGKEMAGLTRRRLQERAVFLGQV